MKYSIWAIPPQPLFNQLQSVIADLSQKYDAPTFEPHMTVLGSFEAELTDLRQKLTQLAQTTNSLQLSLGPVSFSTTYFQSVFVRVNSTAQLMQLNLDTKQLLGVENTVFMPHISLVYGLDEMKIREKTAAQLNLPPTTFEVSTLTIVPATLDPKEWQHLATIPLAK